MPHFARPYPLALATLVLVCVIWGSTFPVLKDLTAELSALDLTLLRYGGAGLCLLPFLRWATPAVWRWGLLLGVVLFLAFWIQTEGLARTSANRNAFVTGLNVLAVPVLAAALGRRAGWRVWLACALAGLGLWLMFYQQAAWNRGDSLTAVAMVLYAVYVLLLEQLGRSQPQANALALSAIQGLCMGACAALVQALQGDSWDSWQRMAALQGVHWWQLAYLALFASALVPVLQIWGQRHVPAVQSALVYGLEPVFAALAAYWWLGELLQGWAWLGAVLLVVALALGALEPPLTDCKNAGQKKPQNSV